MSLIADPRNPNGLPNPYRPPVGKMPADRSANPLGSTGQGMMKGSPGINVGNWQTEMNNYENNPYSYDIQLMTNPKDVFAQNFSGQKQATQQANLANAQSGYQTGVTSLAATGGISAADRMALADQGKRAQVSSAQGSMAGYDQLVAQNLYDTGKYNLGQEQAASDYNVQIQNQRTRDMNQEAVKKSEFLYQQRIKDAFLTRQMEAAKNISQYQAR